MKKVASILAVAVFALGLFATQIDTTLDFDFETAFACGDCDSGDPRGGNS